eukprot:scaffold348_cov329-Pavlova_lutheri.AAC.52
MVGRIRQLLPHPDVSSHDFIDFPTCFVQISFLHQRLSDTIVQANRLEHKVGSIVCVQRLRKLGQFLEVILHFLHEPFSHLAFLFVQHPPFHVCIGPGVEVQDSLALFHGLFAIVFLPTFPFVFGQLHQHVYFEGSTFQGVWRTIRGAFGVFEGRAQEQLSIFWQCLSIVAGCKSSPFEEELPRLWERIPHRFGVLVGQPTVHPTPKVVRQRQMQSHGVHRRTMAVFHERRATLHGRAHAERAGEARSLLLASLSTHAAAFLLDEGLHATSIHGCRRAVVVQLTPSKRKRT